MVVCSRVSPPSVSLDRVQPPATVQRVSIICNGCMSIIALNSLALCQPMNREHCHYDVMIYALVSESCIRFTQLLVNATSFVNNPKLTT